MSDGKWMNNTGVVVVVVIAAIVVFIYIVVLLGDTIMRWKRINRKVGDFREGKSTLRCSHAISNTILQIKCYLAAGIIHTPILLRWPL